MIINFIRGLCMALADSVPGVSGGTIAFIMGFYDKFINSLNNSLSLSVHLAIYFSASLFFFSI